MTLKRFLDVAVTILVDERVRLASHPRGVRPLWDVLEDAKELMEGRRREEPKPSKKRRMSEAEADRLNAASLKTFSAIMGGGPG